MGSRRGYSIMLWLAASILLAAAVIDALQTSLLVYHRPHHHHNYIHQTCPGTRTVAFIGSSIDNCRNRNNIRLLSAKAAQTQEEETAASWSKLTVPQLKSILKEHNLPISGVKAELIQRLEDHYNSETVADGGQQQISANMEQKRTYATPKDETEIQVVEKDVLETMKLLDGLKLGNGKSTPDVSSSSSSSTPPPSSSSSRQLSRQQKQEQELMDELKQSLKLSQQKRHSAQSTESSSSSSNNKPADNDTATDATSDEKQVQSHMEQLRLRSANDLKEELQKLRLPTKGRKPDLVDRLAEHYIHHGANLDDEDEYDIEIDVEIPTSFAAKATDHNLAEKQTMSFAGIQRLSTNAAAAFHQAFGTDPQPTPIQSIAISTLFHPPNPSAILHASTGSGKTIAYLLPITETLWKEVDTTANISSGSVDPNDMSNGIAIILLPTRELAAQVAGVATVLAPPGMVRLVPRPMDIMSLWKDEVDRGEEVEYLERVGEEDNEEEGDSIEAMGKKYQPRILVGSAKSISISLFGNNKLPGTPTNKPQGKSLLSNTRWLIMDEVDRLLDIKKSRTDKKSRHEKPAALLSAAVARLTMGRAQVIAASATVGRPLRRELSRVLGLHSSECPETLRGEEDATSMDERVNDDKTVHVGRAVRIPSTVRNYVLPVDGSTSGSLLTSAAFASKSLLQSSNSFEPSGRRVLVVLTRNCDIKVHNALGALRHFGIKPEPQSLLDALEADGTDRLVEAHRRVSGVEGVGGTKQRKQKTGGLQDDSDEGYLLVTHEDNVRGLHLDGLDAVIVVGRPGSPDEYTHIAGRTGRAGRHGSVLNIVSFEQAAALASWTKMLGVDFLPVDEGEVASIVDE